MTARLDLEEGIIGSRVPRLVDDLPLFAGSHEAQAAKEAGIQAAHDHANQLWKQTAYAALVTCARRLAHLTADDVWTELHGATPATHNLSALGPLFLIAARKGLIAKTGRMVPTRASQRHRDLTEWQSLILDHEGAV